MFKVAIAGWRQGNRSLGVGLQPVRGLVRVEPRWWQEAERFVRAGCLAAQGGAPPGVEIERPSASETTSERIVRAVHVDDGLRPFDHTAADIGGLPSATQRVGAGLNHLRTC